MNSHVILFSIFLLLLQKRKITREELALKFEISKRTVSRHVQTLLDCGVPIMSLQGFEGGYLISDDYRIDSLCFDDLELKTILDALNFKQEKKPDKLIPVVMEKLSTLALQNSLKNKEIFLNEDKIIIDAGGWGLTKQFRGKIEAITRAMNDNNTISIKYINRYEDFTERRFDPYNLILKQGVWYVYGWCHRRGDFRLFKLSRINGIFSTVSAFSVRPGADVYAKLNEEFEEAPQTDIVIEFSSLILPQIEEWLGFDAVYEEGLSLRASATVYGGNELISKLMSFGSSVKIISPPQLQEELMVECTRMLNVLKEK